MQKITFLLLLALGLMQCKEAKTDSAQEVNEDTVEEPRLKISLAEWSLNRELFGGEMDNKDFAAKAAELGFTGIEYVNQFFADKAEDMAYLDSLNMLAKEAGVEQVLIMIDREGPLGSTDEEERNTAVENHKKWVRAAKHLGCHSIRVNAYGEGSPDEVAAAAVDGLGKLAAYAKDYDINVIVENHGGYSSDGKWLSGVMSAINMDNCGTLPDFGNFCLERDPEDPYGKPCLKEYDRYQGISELMPFAKAVSAKANEFDAEGEETKSDYGRIMKIVKDAGYTGYIGVEFEGKGDAIEGIKATKALIEKHM